MYQFPLFNIARPRQRFFVFVALPAIGLAGALVLFGLWSLWITAEKSDGATRDRQVREVRLAIGATLDELAQSQAGVAIWDPAFAEVSKRKPDLNWLDQNVGTWLNYVFNYSGRPRSSSVRNEERRSGQPRDIPARSERSSLPDIGGARAKQRPGKPA
jgi:hypothetical protein